MGKTNILVALLWLSACTTLLAQGNFTITPGAYLRTNGTAAIRLQDTKWDNNGTFTAGSSTLTFSGTNPSGSLLAGFSTDVLYNTGVQRSGGGPLTIGKNIEVTNQLIFSNGLVDLNGFDITLAQPGGMLSGESENSRLFTSSAGEIKLTLDLNAPAQVNPGNLGAALTSAANLGATQIRRGHAVFNGYCDASVQRYFIFEPATNTGLNATMRLYYFDAELNGNPENELHIYRSDDGGLSWTDLGFGARNTTENWVEVSGLNSLSLFTLADANWLGLNTWYLDADGDGRGNAAVSMLQCPPPPGYVAYGDDCDDSNPARHPGASEICDDQDNDCDGTADEDVPAFTWYADTDGDGYGDPNSSLVDCAAPAGYVDNSDDCDDTDSGIGNEAIQMIKNIGLNYSVGLSPAEIVEVNGLLFFRAYNSTSGYELWKSDGTQAGTVQVKDIAPGSGHSFPANLTNINGIIYFTAADGVHGTELWKSDGTEAGTTMVKDINPGANGISPANFNNLSGTLIFTLNNGVNGNELWKSDGTAAGTGMVKDIEPGATGSDPSQFAVMGGKAYFRAKTTSNGEELWKSDGTEAGTVMVKDIQPGTGSAQPLYLAPMGGMLYFQAQDNSDNGYELWKSDGTEAGTVMVKDIEAGYGSSSPGLMANVNGTLFFKATNFLTTGAELWKSDGTAAGTVLVKDINPGTGNSNILSLKNVNGILYFVAEDGANGAELWKSDGTSAGTVMVKDINAGSGNGVDGYNSLFTEVNGALFFRANNGVNGTEWWKSDGSAAGTVLVKDIVPGAGATGTGSRVSYNSMLFMAASDGVNGAELWKSDGTGAGTEMVWNYANTDGPSSPTGFTKVGNTTFFAAANGVDGMELWKTDGTEAGTVMVKDIRPGSAGSSPANLTHSNGLLFFSADDGTNGNELWKSDGTAAGTVLLKDIWPGGSTYFQNLTDVNGTLFFVAGNPYGFALWKTDGTTAGTVMVYEVTPYGGTPTTWNLTNVHGTLFFKNYDGNGWELWKTDGTPGGTSIVKDIWPGGEDSNPHNFLNLNGALYFTANDGTNGIELWKSDGSSAGTVLVKNIVAGSGSSFPANLAHVNNTLYFSAYEGTNGAELWKSDGTETGTVLVKDIKPGSGSALLSELVNANDVLYFTADDGTNGEELWKSNGTAAGTLLVKNIVAGSGGASPNFLTNVGGVLFFRATDGVNGSELWKSDGTEAGTQLVQDIYPGSNGSNPVYLTAVDGALYFSAFDDVNGTEPWRASFCPPETFYADTDGDGFGDPTNIAMAFSAPPGYVSDNTDCDDTDPNEFPNQTWYPDADADGWGGAPLMQCERPAGYFLLAELGQGPGDCDDADPNEFPNQTWYIDADADTYGGSSVIQCERPAEGFLLTELAPGSSGFDDCDDADPDEFPGQIWYLDLDGDQYGVFPFVDCSRPPGGYLLAELAPGSTGTDDCDDNNPAVHPGATETCNGLDDDCDGFPELPPIASITPPAPTICSGASIPLSATGGDSYLWSNGETTPTITVAPTENTTYSVTVTDLLGCQSYANVFVQVANHVPAFDFASATPGDPFEAHVVSPVSGAPMDAYRFRVQYSDPEGDAPAPGFPKALLRFQSGSPHPNDLALNMNRLPGGDYTTGTVYEALWMGGLPAGTDWNVQFTATDEAGCAFTTSLPPAVSEPDVLALPDLSVFASDITFSSYHPAPGATVTIYTRLHNDTDYPANNFVVRLRNELSGTDLGTQTISLPAHSEQTLSWTVALPNAPGWNPIRVFADDTDLIDEVYENNNNAVRPIVVGDYSVSGSIVATAAAGNIFLNSGMCTGLTGTAVYQDLPPATGMNGTSVAGAAVIFWREGGTDTLTTTTNSLGQFSYPAAFCSPPLSLGTYTIKGVVTDYTLADTFETTFTVYYVEPPPPCMLPDLGLSITGPTNCVFPNEMKTYTVRVSNGGLAPAGPTVLKIMPSAGLSPGAPVSVPVPALPNGSFFETTLDLTMPAMPRSVSIAAFADAENALAAECNYFNNTATFGFSVASTLQDLVFAAVPDPNIGYGCLDNSFSVSLANVSCVAAGASSLRVVVTKIAGGATWEDEQPAPALNPGEYATLSFPDLFPAVFPDPGDYRMDIYLDDNGEAAENNEDNNRAVAEFSIEDCYIDLAPDCGFQTNQLTGNDGTAGTLSFPVRVYNHGLALQSNDFEVLVEIVHGASVVASVSYTETEDIAPGAYADENLSIAGVDPCAAEYRLRVTVDVQDDVPERFETNNDCLSPRLFRDYRPENACLAGYNFWDYVYPTNVPFQPYAWVLKRGDFQDDALAVQLDIRKQGDPGWQALGTAAIGPLVGAGGDVCPQFRADAPQLFTFTTPGIWEMRVIVDPENERCETDEGNNQIIRTFLVAETPDFVALSQWINPETLNPAPGQSISVDVSFKNTGQSVTTTEPFSVQLKLDQDVVGTINLGPGYYPYNGLTTLTFPNIAMPNTYSNGNTPEAHVLRVIVDAGGVVTETNELNNEATRVIIIGGAPDARVPNLAYAGGIIAATVKNFGGSPVGNGVLRLYYQNFSGLEFEIPGAQDIALGSLPANGQATKNFAWTAPSDAHLLIARVSEVSPVETNDLNNEQSLELAPLPLLASVTNAPTCGDFAEGAAAVSSVSGGTPPYEYLWSTGATTASISDLDDGAYTVTISDDNGQVLEREIVVMELPGATYYLDADGDSYGVTGNTLYSCTGMPAGYATQDGDCDDAAPLIHPGAAEICNDTDDDCNGMVDDVTGTGISITATDYCSIQKALDAPGDNALIRIAAGTYGECITVTEHARLEAVGGPVILQCVTMNGAGKTLELDSDLQIDALELTGGLIRTNGFKLTLGAVTGGGPASYIVTD